MGYLKGAHGEGGTVDRGMAWAFKTGFLLLTMSVVIGVFGGAVLSRVKMPDWMAWALVMALAFAIQNGGSVVLGMSRKEFWPETFRGLLFGAVLGGIMGPIQRRIQSKPKRQTPPPDPT
jgi:hypothetical protein